MVTKAENPKERLEQMANKMRESKAKKFNFTKTNCVEIIHVDGSKLFLHSALVVKEALYFYIFTEHHGNSFYHKEDVKEINEYILRYKF